MTYILEELLTVRKFREQAALNHMVIAEKEAVAARRLREDFVKQLSDYIQWRKNEELRMFEELRCKFRKIDHLQHFNQCVEELREKQNALATQLKQAEQMVQKAENNLENAKKQYVRFNREKRKIEEHREIWLQEMYINDERLAEEEMDEFSISRGDVAPIF